MSAGVVTMSDTDIWAVTEASSFCQVKFVAPGVAYMRLKIKLGVVSASPAGNFGVTLPFSTTYFFVAPCRESVGLGKLVGLWNNGGAACGVWGAAGSTPPNWTGTNYCYEFNSLVLVSAGKTII
jgi:hypothetical protein